LACSTLTSTTVPVKVSPSSSNLTVRAPLPPKSSSRPATTVLLFSVVLPSSGQLSLTLSRRFRVVLSPHSLVVEEEVHQSLLRGGPLDLVQQIVLCPHHRPDTADDVLLLLPPDPPLVYSLESGPRRVQRSGVHSRAVRSNRDDDRPVHLGHLGPLGTAVAVVRDHVLRVDG